MLPWSRSRGADDARTATPFLQARYRPVYDDDDDDVVDVDGDTEPLMDTTALDSQRLDKRRRWKRRRRVRCCLLTSVLLALFVGVVVLPMVYFVAVPYSVRHAIETAPAPHFRLLNVDRIWAHNDSISFDVDAYFDVGYGPAARFYGATFAVGVILPRETAVRHIASADFGDMVTDGWGAPLDLKFRATLHSFNVPNTRMCINATFKYVEVRLGGDGESGDGATVPPLPAGTTPYVRVILRGNAVTHTMGMDFPSIQFTYALPLQFDFGDLLAKLDPQVVEDSEDSDAGIHNESSRDEDDDDDEKPRGVLRASIRNPTPFAFNFGSVNMTVYQPGVVGASPDREFAYAYFTPLALPYLNRSENGERAVITAELGLITGLLSTGLSVVIKGDAVHLLGYHDDDVPLLWFHNIFRGLEIRLGNIAQPTQLMPFMQV